MQKSSAVTIEVAKKTTEDTNNYIIESWGINGILKKKKLQRTREDINMIEENFNHVELLQLIKKKTDYKKYRDLLSEIRYKHALKGEYLYNKGDKEDNFYIVLNGHVVIERVTDQELQIIKDLTPGDSFGDLTLSEAPVTRKFNAAALEDTQLAFFDKKTFLNTLDNVKSQVLRQIDDIAQNSLFSTDWGTFSLMSLAFHFKPKEYLRESFIYREGDLASEVYFLRSGQVECSKNIDYGFDEVENGTLTSGRRLKWAHLALWTDFAIFGYEEFYRVDPSMYDNLMSNRIRREASVEVISDKAEIWSMNAQTFLDFFSDHRSKMKDLISLMRQRLKRREQAYKKTVKLEKKNFSYGKTLSPPIFDSPVNSNYSNSNNKNDSKKQLVVRELSLDDKMTLTNPEIKKYDYVKFENSVLLSKKKVTESKMIQTLPPAKPFFTTADMLASQSNTLETLSAKKKDYSIDLKPLSPPYLLENSPRSPRIKEIDSKFLRPNPLKPKLKPLHPKDSNSISSFVPYVKTPKSKPFINLNFTYDHNSNTTFSDMDDQESDFSWDSVVNKSAFLANFNKKLIILEPLKLNEKDSESSFIIKNSNPKSPYKSSYKNYLEHKMKMKKNIKWKNPLKFKLINEEIIKKNPFKYPQHSSSNSPPVYNQVTYFHY